MACGSATCAPPAGVRRGWRAAGRVLTFNLTAARPYVLGWNAGVWEAARETADYRPDVDGLRTVAVGLVVAAHAFPSVLPGGFVGVDVFFVISGYLISSILLRDLDRGRFSLADFYMRRALRIFPVLLAVMAAVAAAGWVFLYQAEFEALGGHLLSSALFAENMKLSGEIGYFDLRAAGKPTLHLWSLAIEEQFYLVWPLLLAFLVRRRRALAPALAALAALSFALGLAQVHADPEAAYYSTGARAWELILGAVLAVRAAQGADGLGRFRELGAAAGFTLIALSALVLRPCLAFPGWLALGPTLGAALILAAGARAGLNARFLAAAPMAAMGRVSYPLYLWHWPLLSFAHILFGKPAPAMAAVCVALSVALAFLSHRLIEQPLRRLDLSPVVKARTLGGAMAAMALIGAALAEGALPSRLHGFAAPTRTEWDFLKARTPGFRPDGDGVYVLAPERAEKVLFIGDSHLAQYAERLNEAIAAQSERPGAVLALGGGCAPIPGVTTPDPQRAGCAGLETRAWDMARSGGFSTLVVGAAWNWYLRYGDFFISAPGHPMPLSSPEGTEAALDWLAGRFREAKAAGLRVVFVLDEPEAPGFAPADWPLRYRFSATGFAPDRLASAPADEIALHARLRDWALAQGVEVVDPFAAVCAGDLCRVTTATGRPLYKDDNHFNPDWARENAGFIDATVAPRRPR